MAAGGKSATKAISKHLCCLQYLPQDKDQAGCVHNSTFRVGLSSSANTVLLQNGRTERCAGTGGQRMGWLCSHGTVQREGKIGSLISCNQDIFQRHIDAP